MIFFMLEYIERKLVISAVRYKFGRVGQKVMPGLPYAGTLTPVVYCKDCIHRNSQLNKDGGVYIACYKIEPNNFYSHGEKAEKKNMI